MNINLYGLLIAAAITIGYFLCAKEEKARQLPKDTAIDIVLYSIPFAIIGARLYYVAFAWNSFKYNIISIFYIWQGGLAIYGGIIGGLFGLYLLSKKRHLPLPLLTDVISPSLILGQAIGRWGNYFNQEAHGKIVQDIAWQFFPAAVNISGQWYYATFFYESAWNLIGFIFLYLSRKKYYKNHGIITIWYITVYSLGRMVIEMMRTDSLMLGSIRVSQGLSILLFVIAVVLLSKKSYAPIYVYILLFAGSATVIIAAMRESMMCLFLGALILLITSVIVYLNMEKRRKLAKTDNI
ncbi:MAG: prolipoprotein diacylglyceryl transferase [Eubacteriales bacterium]|nr:prolipoprotein diacylglyceryl transferase [Eubacteriales bacterium]